MPKEIPGFYYDEEKNRYFPVKGPIPGSKSISKPSSASSAKPTLASAAATSEKQRSSGSAISRLVQARQLDGNVLHLKTNKRRKFSFEDEILNNQVSQPQVWRYDESGYVAESALEIMPINMITPEGLTRVPVLLAGSIHGLLSPFVVGKTGEHLAYGVKCTPTRVSSGEESERRGKPPAQLSRLPGAYVKLSSDISCIKSVQRRSRVSTASHTLITTLGSDRFGGSVYVLNPADTFDSHSQSGNLGQVHPVVSFSYTIWTADCSSNNIQAVVGTNRGAALVDLETGKKSWVLRSESDVLAQQFDQSGNGILCGLRNGAILTVDVRDRHGTSSTRLRKHLIPCQTSNKNDSSSTKRWIKINGNVYPSRTAYMPKSVASLLSLQLYDQYFLASSMDGSIKLYDQRLVDRGPVQSYEGHVNTHSRLQLGVDPSEKFVISGGEDGGLRIWSIRSGKLLFENKLFSSYPLTLRTHTVEGLVGQRNQSHETASDHNHAI